MPAIIKTESLCAGECGHIDCIALKQVSAARCRLCRMAIGFERAYYSEGAGHVHADCLHGEIAAKTAIDAADEPKYLTTEKAAAILDLSPSTLKQWVKDGRIPYRKLNGETRFLLSEILEWSKPKPKGRSGLAAVG